jgi:hypothetical protein
MKIKKKTLVISLVFFLITLTSYAFAQMGGGMMGGGYRGGQGMGGGGGGQGYGPGPGYGYGQGPGQGQAAPNLSPEEQKARSKAFVDEYIRRYLPEYKLEKRDSKDSK